MRLLTALFALAASSALADVVDVSISPTAQRGKGLPFVSVQILEPIAGFRLMLTRDDGKKVDVKGGGKPGVTRRIELEQKEGKAAWKGELVVNAPNGTQSTMPLEFETTLFVPLFLQFDKTKDADIAGRKVYFKLTNPAQKAVLRVLMDTGDYAFDGEVPFNGDPPGTRLMVSWPEAKGQVMRVDLRAYDTGGFFTGVELTPWQVNIPHEEVNFDTGKWDLRAEEQPKLDKSYQLIADAVEKFGRLAEIRLYVAGHTDSVGPNAHNLGLSLNRARSIGGYFRKKGLRIPIYYEGFGEEALLVATPDETEEQKNRRAEYIISIDDPAAKNTGYVAKWKRL